jgi:hypothetical protein
LMVYLTRSAVYLRFSLLRMVARWASAVRTLMERISAISLFDLPEAISFSTSVSRSESGSGTGTPSSASSSQAVRDVSPPLADIFNGGKEFPVGILFHQIPLGAGR